jgi:uncharacterized NAD-dependent epimerase/dehydratase family protein
MNISNKNWRPWVQTSSACSELCAPPGLDQATEMVLAAVRLTNIYAHFAGISVNTALLPESDSRAMPARYEAATGLPCVDPIRTGVGALVDRLQALNDAAWHPTCSRRRAI